jgi:hypothetical protein
MWKKIDANNTQTGAGIKNMEVLALAIVVACRLSQPRRPIFRSHNLKLGADHRYSENTSPRRLHNDAANWSPVGVKAERLLQSRDTKL